MMRDLLRSRRGSVAFATVVAMVPLLGAIALGGEAASWYVTKQHAQNAADAAAYSGALKLACAIGLSTACGDNQTVDYRAKEFAAQNGFCNAGDTGYPGSTCATSYTGGVTRSVAVATLTSWNGNAGNFVQATVTQSQPAYLAALLGLTTVDIGAKAVAQVRNPNAVCGLGLSTSSSSSNAGLTLGGGLNLTGDGCGLMSDGIVKFNSGVTASGTGWSAYSANGCSPSSTCSSPGLPYNYYMPSATNPLKKLDSEPFNSSTGSAPKQCTGLKTCALSGNSPTNLYGDLKVTTGDTVTLAAGTYFFYNASISVTGGSLTGTGVSIVMLGNSSLTINGGTVSLSAPATNAAYPDLNGVLFDDQAPSGSSNAVSVNGGGNVSLGGAMYFPNVDVTWSGTTKNTNNTCSEIIAKTLTMTGSAYMSTTGCSPGTVPFTQVVALVQ